MVHCLTPQVGKVLKAFSMGDELVTAAAVLFTRSADLESHMSDLTTHMSDRDIRSLQQELGWYSYFRFSNPTGEWGMGCGVWGVGRGVWGVRCGAQDPRLIWCIMACCWLPCWLPRPG